MSLSKQESRSYIAEYLDQLVDGWPNWDNGYRFITRAIKENNPHSAQLDLLVDFNNYIRKNTNLFTDMDSKEKRERIVDSFIYFKKLDNQ